VFPHRVPYMVDAEPPHSLFRTVPRLQQYNVKNSFAMILNTSWCFQQCIVDKTIHDGAYSSRVNCGTPWWSPRCFPVPFERMRIRFVVQSSTRLLRHIHTPSRPHRRLLSVAVPDSALWPCKLSPTAPTLPPRSIT
jgi:hypothetical protein